jgi:hypothetical protein
LAEESKKVIQLPDDLYQEVEKRASESGFDSVDNYVIFVLKEVTSEETEEDESSGYSPKEEKEVEERLRNLGYLD